VGIRRCQPLVLALWNEADGGLPAGLRGAAVLRYWKIPKNMDNYPPGAANDPRAPWNQPEWPEIDIRVEAKLVKETVVQGSGSHTVTECEIEPDGTKSYISFTESDDDVRELFDDQCRNPMKRR